MVNRVSRRAREAICRFMMALVQDAFQVQRNRGIRGVAASYSNPVQWVNSIEFHAGRG